MQKWMVTALAAVFVSLADAAVYHVDNRKGDDGNDGLSVAHPFKTLAKATSMLRAGDVLEIAPGTPYRESLVVFASGTAKAPIVIRGNGAVLTGLEPVPDAAWQDKGENIFFAPNKACWGGSSAPADRSSG